MKVDVANGAQDVMERRIRIEDWFRGLPVVTRLDVAPDAVTIICRGLSGNVTAIRDAEGLVLCDTGAIDTCETVLASVREWEPDAPIRAVIYTHGHFDHVAGMPLIDRDAEARGAPRPVLVAHENAPRRFERYRRTGPFNERINIRQYSRPGFRWPTEFREPDVLVRKSHRLAEVGEAIELRHGMGETDDHMWVWLPKRRLAVIGDFYTWAAPNAGNPQKAQRYVIEWAETLRAIVAAGPEVVVPGHGPVIFGREAIASVLGDIAAWLESLHDQTLALLNSGIRPSDIPHRVAPPEHLSDLPWLKNNYDDPEFVVRAMCRLYGGWWDGNPAHLKPAPDDELAREIALAAGGADRLARRADSLAKEGRLRLACHFAEFAAQAAPSDLGAQATRARIYDQRLKAESGQMAKGVFRDAIQEAESRIASPGGELRARSVKMK